MLSNIFEDEAGRVNIEKLKVSCIVNYNMVMLTNDTKEYNEF